MFQSMQDLLRFLREQDLSMTHYSLLMRLYKIGPCGVSEAAALLGITKAAASQMVDRLVKQGLITRTEHEVDRRHTRLMLSAKGQKLTEQCIAARYAWLKTLPPLPHDKEKALLIGLNELTQTAENAFKKGFEKT